MSAAAKFARAILDLDAQLRRMSVDGTRISVTAAELSGPMNSTTQIISQALFRMCRMEGSGLKSAKGGRYEYRTPDVYPSGLQELKDRLNKPNAQSEAPTKDSTLQSRVIAFFREHPDELYTLRDVSREVEGNLNSVSNCLTRLAQRGYLTDMSSVTQGSYLHRSSNSTPVPEEPQVATASWSKRVESTPTPPSPPQPVAATPPSRTARLAQQIADAREPTHKDAETPSPEDKQEQKPAQPAEPEREEPKVPPLPKVDPSARIFIECGTTKDGRVIVREHVTSEFAVLEFL